MTFVQSSGGNNVFFKVFPTHTVVGSVEARECSSCHTMTHFYVNRQGETKCVGCDDAKGDIARL